ncbi:HET-domain-containing protein, partial [Aulographum hederae CBS 113979]
RLIELWPAANFEAPPECYLHPVNLDANPPYDAISYCWGHPSEKLPIQANGSPIRIPSNLSDALRYLRSPTEVRVLWADALCINQGDDKERGHQVAQMGRIFWQADKVHAWLG